MQSVLRQVVAIAGAQTDVTLGKVDRKKWIDEGLYLRVEISCLEHRVRELEGCRE